MHGSGLLQAKRKITVTYSSRFSDFALYLEDYLIYEHDSLE